MAERDPHTDAPNEPQDTAPDGREDRSEHGGARWTFGRVVGTLLGGLVALVVALVLVVVLLLQTDWGAAQAKSRLVPLVNNMLQEGAELHVGELDGSFLTNLRLYDATLLRADGDTLVHVDTARVGYNLLGLLRGRLALDEMTVLDPTVRMEQREDSTWDLVSVFPQDTTQQGGTTVLLDEALLRDGNARLHFYSPNRDSVLYADDLNARLSGLQMGPEMPLALELDTLWGRYLLPDAADSVRVAAGGSLSDRHLAIDGLSIDSPNSDVRAAGSLALPSDTSSVVQAIDLEVHARPLALRDLHPFAPSLNPDATVTLDAQFGGTSRELAVDAEGRTGGGATFVVDGVVTPAAEGPLTYRFDAELRELDPGYFTTGPSQTPTVLSADLSADLAGTDLQTLTGTLEGRVYDSQIATTQIQEATIDGTFDDGTADVSLRADLSGGTFVLDGGGRLFDEVPSYRADGRFQNVHIGRLTDNPQQQSDLTGTLAIDGRGTDPETATIEATLDVQGTLNGNRIERADGDLRLADGNLRFDTDFAFPGGALALEGRGTFQGGTASYRISQGRFRNLNVGALAGNAEQQSDLTGTFTLRGSGLSLQEADVQGSLDLATSSYGTYQIESASAQFGLANERLRLDGNASLVGGTFAADGTVNLAGDVPSYNLSGRFRNVHLGTLLNNPQQQSDLTGTFSVRGTGFDPQAGTIRADLRLTDSSLNGRSVERGTLDLTLRQGGLAFDVDFATAGGDLAARGTANLGPTISYRIREGSFENLDIATFTGDTTQTSDLTGTFTATGRGAELATMTLDAEVDLDRSVYNEQQIMQGTLSIDLARGDVDVLADIQTPDGGFRVRGGGDLLADRPTFALQEGTFRNVDVGAFIGAPRLSTSLTGRVMLEGAGTDLTAATLDATIELDSSRINQARLIDGRLEVELGDGLLDASGQLNFADGRAVFDANAAFAGETPGDSLLRYGLQADLDRIDVGALAGIDTLDARASFEIDLAGSGTDPETMELQAALTGRQIAYQDVDVQRLRLQAAVRDGVVRVDTLLMRANFADATAGGRIALWSQQTASDFHFSADIENLGPLRPFIPAETVALNDGQLEGRVYGTRNTMRVTAAGEVTSLVYNDIRVAGFDGTVNLAVDSLQQIERGEVRAELNYFSLPTLTIEQAELQARYDSSQVAFDGELTVDERREADFSGQLDLRPGRELLQVDALNLRFDDDRWELLQPVTVAYDGEYRVSGFLLYSGDQQIAIDGVVDPDGQQNLVLTIEGVDIDPITDLLQYDGLGGTLTGSIDLSGPADAPNLDGVLLADLRSFDDPVGTLRLGVDYDSLRLQLDALLTHRDGSTLSADGYLVYDFNIGTAEGAQQGVRLQAQQANENAIDFTAEADSFAIGWVEPFVDPETVESIDGRLTGDVQISGTIDAPELQGEAQLFDGRVELPQLGLAYTDIRAEAVFEDDRIRLQRARMRSGGGQLTAEGVVNVQEITSASFDLQARARDFLAMDTRDLSIQTNADLSMTGTTREPVIRGDVRVLSADFYLEEQAGGGDLRNVTLKEEDVQMLERYFGVRLTEADTTTFDFYEASTIELDIELERDTWVRSRSNPELNIQLTGDVDFVKPPNEAEQVFGTIEVIESRSYIKQFGRRFNITSGMLRFNGEATNPAIDATAEYEVKSKNSTGDAQVVITLGIEGRLQDPDISLGSDPPMENVDIISYIATGQPAGRGLNLEGQGGGLLGRGESLAFGQVAGWVEGIAAENLGLDVVEVQQEGLNNITLTLGKYVTPRLYAAVRQPLSNLAQQSEQGTGTGTEFTLEYELLEWLLGRATQRDNTLRLDLFWEYSY